MLGLGLSITSVSGLRSLASKLLGILRSRSTYSENNVSSNAIIDAIDNVGVLDDATILLTPTAYSDARVHSVKTYTGDEYITNGDFSDGETGWTITGAAASATQSVVDGALVMYSGIPSDANNALSKTDTLQGYNGHIYKLEITASDFTVSPNGYLRLDGVYDASNIIAFSASISTVYFTAYRDFTFVRFFAGGADQGYTIDNVSLIDVSSDFDFDRASSATRINSDGLVQDMQSITDPELVLNGDFEELGDDVVTNGTFDTDSDWTLTGGWSITDNKLSCDGTNNSLAYQFLSSLNSGDALKVTYTISDYTSGTLRIGTGAGLQQPSGIARTSNGTYVEYITKTDSLTAFGFRSYSFDGSIDNVSVQQVDPNDRWTVVDSDADNYVEFTEGFARLKFLNTSPVTAFSTSNSILQGGQTYKLVVDVHDVTSGGIKIDGSGISELFNTEGITTRYITPTGATSLVFYRATADVDITLASVSVKDITFSTDVDLARINYDSNGENGHWLLEPTSTNEITYSEDFSQTIWTKNDVLVEGGYTAPDGSNTAYKVTNNGGNAHLVGYYNINTGKRKSIWAKTVSGTGDVDLLNQNGNNLFTLTNEWQRFDATHAGAANFFYAVDFRGASATLSEVIVWGCQLEDLSYATSYIPTYGSTVTRATETLTGSGNSTLINSTEGVLYAEIAALVDDNSAREITLSDGTADNRIELRYGAASNRIQLVARSGGVVQASLTNSTNNILNFNKVAVKWKANDFALWINGVEQGADTSGSTPIGLNELQFNEGDGAGGEFLGKVKALAVFDEALKDIELQNLTS